MAKGDGYKVEFLTEHSFVARIGGGGLSYTEECGTAPHPNTSEQEAVIDRQRDGDGDDELPRRHPGNHWAIMKAHCILRQAGLGTGIWAGL
jgi:hypothetical protein